MPCDWQPKNLSCALYARDESYDLQGAGLPRGILRNRESTGLTYDYMRFLSTKNRIISNLGKEIYTSRRDIRDQR